MIVIEKLSLNKFEMLFFVRLQTERDTATYYIKPKTNCPVQIIELSLGRVILETKHISMTLYSS